MRESRHQCAFTLAEVLITLGVIGVVAAMTIPTLISNYQKKQTETKLLHFHSIMQQAGRMRLKDEIEGGFIDMEPPLAINNPEAMLSVFNHYYGDYLKVSVVEKTQKGIIVSLLNGSAFYMRKDGTPDSIGANVYITFCTEYKYCKQIDESIATAHNVSDGKHTFVFWFDAQPPTSSRNRAGLIEACRSNGYQCSTLLKKDGWKIHSDYPRW